jgi:hypothetical protein
MGLVTRLTALTKKHACLSARWHECNFAYAQLLEIFP